MSSPELMKLFDYPNGDISYKNKQESMHYLYRGNTLIAQGMYVWSYMNNDYCFRDTQGTAHLLRDGKILYKTGPGHMILSHNTQDKHNTKYKILYRDILKTSVVEELNFPFDISLLNIIDNKIKGEL